VVPVAVLDSVLGGAVFVRVTTTVLAGWPEPPVEHAGTVSSSAAAKDTRSRRRSITNRR
jgi:hypothetical protein